VDGKPPLQTFDFENAIGAHAAATSCG
jgi:hypothetical protein